MIFRPTTRICHSSAMSTPEVGAEHRTAAFRGDPKQYVVIPAHTRVLHKKLNEKQPALKKRLVELGYNRHTVRGRTAVVTSGVAAAYVQEVLPDDVSLAVIGAYPIDEEWLRAFVDQHENVLVIEELAPVIEEAVRQVATKTEVFGKMTGTVPYEENSLPRRSPPPCRMQAYPTVAYPAAAPVRGAAPSADPLRRCMHRSTFYAMKKVFRDGIFPSDIRCFTPSLRNRAVDTTICMGASITVGSGIARSGEKRPVVCTIGDSTFLHTGIPGLLNAVYNGAGWSSSSWTTGSPR